MSLRSNEGFKFLKYRMSTILKRLFLHLMVLKLSVMVVEGGLLLTVILAPPLVILKTAQSLLIIIEAS